MAFRVEIEGFKWQRCIRPSFLLKKFLNIFQFQRILVMPKTEIQTSYLELLVWIPLCL